MGTGGDTARRILDAAQALTQRRGFNAFSYKDVAAAVGIRHPSVHHHFPTKAALGVALVRRYRDAFAAELAAIDSAEPDAGRALERYARLYEAAIVQDERLCLCAMLSAEAETLPDAVRAEVRGFFEDNERWLARRLDAGRAAGTLAFPGTPRAAARALLATLEGAMILVRGTADPAAFTIVAEHSLARLRPPG
jgi:TetR/AcrR family transcriptional repressor of nem operon